MLIIAHRGASGDRPEHSRSAHALAIEQGADIIEPDLVFSADGELLVRHDLGLSRSTDIACRPEFANLRRDCDGVQDWLANDLDWLQLGRLRCVQPWPQRSAAHDGIDGLLRLSDLLQLAAAEGKRRNRKIVVYAETKHPAWHRQRGFDFVAALHRTLAEHGPLQPNSELWIQSFEWDVLDRVRAELALPVYALIDTQTAFEVSELVGRFDGVGIAKQLIDPRHDDSRTLVNSLAEAGLQIHAWTFRHDLPGTGWADAESELGAYLQMPLAALFCDFPGRARQLRDRLAMESATLPRA